MPDSQRTLTRPALVDATVFSMSARHLDLTVFGVDWSVDTSTVEDELHDQLTHLWARAHTPREGATGGRHQGGPPQTFLVTHEPLEERAGVTVPQSADEFPYAFSRALTLASINRRAGTCLLLHAAGLAVPSGATAVLVAPSGTGKTTATRLLGRTLGYLSDETVVLEADHSISPYPKPLSVIVDDDRNYHKEESSPDDLGLLPAPESPHLGAVVLLERSPEFTTPELTGEPLIHTLVDLIPQTSALALLTDPLERLAKAVTTNGGPYRLRYAEIDKAATLLTDLLVACDAEGGPTLEPVTWIHYPGIDGPEPAADPGTAPLTETTTFHRAQWRDALESEGEILVLLDTIPAHLAGLGALLWRSCADPLTLGEAHALAVSVLGDHPDAEGLVREAAEALFESRVLERLS